MTTFELENSTVRPTTLHGVRPWSAYTVAGLASHGSNLLMGGIFFYTTQQFGWKPWQNLSLAAGQGLIYVIGGLMAQQLAGWFGRYGTLIALHSAMALVGIALLLSASPLAAAVILVSYTFFSAANWPVLTSLLSTGTDPSTLSRRISLYNLTWSGVGAATVAISGTIIDHWPMGLFAIPVLAHLAAAVLLIFQRSASDQWIGKSSPDLRHCTPLASIADPAWAHLLYLRQMSLWVSRISLPAVFVVAYSLLPLMPSLPALSPLSTSSKTAVCSTWMVTRCLMFALLGATAWWHTPPRPRRLLLGAACIMLAAFLGITIQASSIFGLDGPSLALDVSCLFAWQVFLGLAMGMIYSASLYFGMVLSNGSTEHGGYHEALVGLGSVLGPGSGAIAQLLAPGSSRPSIITVTVILALTVMAAATATLMLGRRRRRFAAESIQAET